jgi:hypothetical protein
MNRTFSACLAAAILFLASPARGALLFQRSLSVDRSVNIFTTSHFDLKVVLGDSFSAPTNPVQLIQGVVFTPADAPRLFSFTSTNAGFSAVATRITDGLDQFVKLTLTETASGRSEQRGWRESGFFVGHGSTEIPDLKGAIVEEIQLRLDSFHLGSGPSPTSAALPPVDVKMTFTVMGTVIPEPSALLLGLGGLAAAGVAAYTGRLSRHA